MSISRAKRLKEMDVQWIIFMDENCGSTGDKEYFRNLFYVRTIKKVFFFSLMCNLATGP